MQEQWDCSRALAMHWRHFPHHCSTKLEICVIWSQTEGSITLISISVPPETSLDPLDLLNLIRCSCQSPAPCKIQRCSCCSDSMQRTSLCVCHVEHECQNEQNEDVENAEDGGWII